MIKFVKLGDACLVRRGTTITKKQTKKGNIPVIAGGRKATYFHNKHNREFGTITISGSGASAGLVNYWSIPIFASDCSTVELKDNKQNVKFIYYYLQFMQEFIYKNMRSGAAQPHVYAKDIANLNFPLLSLEEQQRIVAKLDAAFSEINKLILTTKRKQEKFAKLYASVVTKQYFSDANVAVVKLGEIAKIKGGKRLPKGKKLTKKVTDFPYIRVTDFTNEGTIDETSVQYITEDIQKKISRYTISAEDVYVSIAGTIGKTGTIPESLNNANLTENAAKIVLDKKCLRDYFYYFTTSSSFEEQALKQTRTAAQPKLALERLAEVKLPLHKISQQKIIIDKLKIIQKYKNSLLNINKKQIDNYKVLKSKILEKKLEKGLT